MVSKKGYDKTSPYEKDFEKDINKKLSNQRRIIRNALGL